MKCLEVLNIIWLPKNKIKLNLTGRLIALKLYDNGKRSNISRTMIIRLVNISGSAKSVSRPSSLYEWLWPTYLNFFTIRLDKNIVLVRLLRVSFLAHNLRWMFESLSRYDQVDVNSYLSNSELELEWLRSVSRRVELLSVLQGAGVVHRQDVCTRSNLVAKIWKNETESELFNSLLSWNCSKIVAVTGKEERKQAFLYC